MPSLHTPGRRTRRVAAGVPAVAVFALVLAACSGTDTTGGGGSSTGGSASGGTLNVAASAPPTSLDPMLQSVDQINNMYINAAYDSLTRIDKDGKVQPDLATEWKYTDDAHTTMDVTLRSGVKFSDGSAMTAKSVAASLTYGKTKGVNGPNWMGSVDSFTAKDDSTVTIKCKEPNDALPYLMSQRLLLGSIVSDKASADPTILKTATYGAGPYMLDPNQTTANDTYTYVPNPNYWDPTKIKFDKIVIKVVANYTAALQAVQNGTADLFSGDRPTATAAKAAGLTVATAPFGLTGIGFSDRNGEIVPALKDPKVRQALSYAIDRTSIANAVFGGFSTPASSMLVKGWAGASGADTSAYTYDMAKAKQLLAEAGYGSGFSFNMSVPTANGTNLMAQAVVQSWAQLGVQVQLQTYTDLGQLTKDILAKKFPVNAFNYGALPTYIQSKSFFNGGSTQFNPFNLTDPQIDASLKAGASGADATAQDAGYAAAWNRSLTDLAWVTNVYTRDQVTVYDSKKIGGVFISTQNPVVDLGWTVTRVAS